MILNFAQTGYLLRRSSPLEALDLTSSYQDEYLEEVGNLYTTSFVPSDAGVEVWAALDSVTVADIPGGNDALASIPNQGTGADLAQSTSAQRPLFKTSIGQYVEPVWSGTYDNTDSWWRNQLKCMRISTTTRMTMAPSVQNPTYIEGYIVVNLTSGTTVIWSHRSESTRLIQIGVAATTNKYNFQLRSSAGVLKTLLSTVVAFRGETDIIYFRFDKTGNNHALSVNGETEVVDTTNFGAETFNSTHQTWGGFTVDAGANYSAGAVGNYYELILKYSAFTSQHKSDCLKYLRYKYIEYGLSPSLHYTEKANRRLISVGENPVTILANIAADTYVKFAEGEHSITDDIVISASNVSIEIPTGAIIKRANNSTSLAPAEIVYNQLVAANISMQGTYSGTDSADFWIKVDGTGTPNTFSWQKQAGTSGAQPSPYANTGVAITGGWQTLSDGIQIMFASTTGNALDSGAIVTVGAKYHGFRIGTGFQVTPIENVKIFGGGTINMNQTNNKNHAVHSEDLPYGVLFHGRVKNCGVYGVTITDIHRTVGLYGDHNGTYNAGGSTTGGESFDASFIDIIETNCNNAGSSRYGILLGHPQHRGQMDYIRCDRNIVHTDDTCIEPNFNLASYSCCDNTVTRDNGYDVNGLIHSWRRSDDGVVVNNTQVTSAKPLVYGEGAPAGWESPVNILDYNNVTV